MPIMRASRSAGFSPARIQHVALEDFELADHAAGVDHAGIEQPDGGFAVAGERGAGVEARALDDAVDQPDRRDVAGDEVGAGEDAAGLRRVQVLFRRLPCQPLQLLDRAAGIEPVGDIALRRQAWQQPAPSPRRRCRAASAPP